MKVLTLKVLDIDEAKLLMADIEKLDCRKYFGDYPTGYGWVLVYITYSNGEAEVISSRNVAPVDSNGEWHGGVEYLKNADFYPLIAKYIDPELVPEISKFLK